MDGQARGHTEELDEACKKANIHSFITAQPQWYDTHVGTRGSSFREAKSSASR